METGAGQGHKPFNPYYIGAYFALAMSVVAVCILNLSETSLRSSYEVLQRIGAEDVLTHIHRTSHIKIYLLAKGEELRWMMIALYYAILLPSFLLVLPLSLLPAKKYLAWYATVNPFWMKPLSNPRAVSVIYGICGLVIFAFSFDLLRAAYFLEAHYKYLNTIQNDNFGFFGLAIKVGGIILMVQGLHYGWSRQSYEAKR